MDYFENMNYGLKKYKKLYPDSPRLAAVKLIFRAIKYLIKGETKILFPKDNKIHIICNLHGGLGDILIALNYLLYFKDKFHQNVELNIAVSHIFIKEIKTLLNGYDFIDSIVLQNSTETSKFDLLFDLVRMPIIKEVNEFKIKNLNPELWDWIIRIKNFNTEHEEYTDFGTCADGLLTFYTLLHNQNRLSQADIFNEFNILSKFKITPSDEDAVLNKFNLTKGKYILFQGGAGINSVVKGQKISTREWDIDNFTKLAKYVHKEFPELLLLQVGYNNGLSIGNIDKNLCGKTDFNELLVLLAHAKYLISTESGAVHFRHFINQKTSIVLFGPTSAKVFGYPENINISSGICPGCEWKHEHWREKCLLTNDYPKCMINLTPEMVLQKIKELI